MEKEFAAGDRVQLIIAPPFIKTADSMPMLRPANLIAIGETGTVLARRPSGYWSVRFSNGDFLLEAQYLEFIKKT